jgi:hypothetical protein
MRTRNSIYARTLGPSSMFNMMGKGWKFMLTFMDAHGTKDAQGREVNVILSPEEMASVMIGIPISRITVDEYKTVIDASKIIRKLGEAS